MIICPQCDTQNQDQNKFCYICGKSLDDVAQKTTDSPVQSAEFSSESHSFVEAWPDLRVDNEDFSPADLDRPDPISQELPIPEKQDTFGVKDQYISDPAAFDVPGFTSTDQQSATFYAQWTQQSAKPTPQAWFDPNREMVPEAALLDRPEKKPVNLVLILSLLVIMLLIASAVLLLLQRNQNMKLKAISIESTQTADHQERVALSREQTATKEAQDLSLFTSQTETQVAQQESASAATSAARTATANAQATKTQQARKTATAEAEIARSQARTATKQAEEEEIARLIPEAERWRLEYATKLTDVNEYYETPYVYDRWLETAWIADGLKNFILTVTFENPPDVIAGEHWDLGILFRSKGGNDQFRIYTTTPDYWELAYVGGTVYDWKIVRGIKGEIHALNRGSGESNTLTLVSDGDSGAFYINGVHIADLDLRSRPNYGYVMAWYDYRSRQRDGQTLIFKDIHIWDLD
jgi:hypothetical protein